MKVWNGLNCFMTGPYDGILNHGYKMSGSVKAVVLYELNTYALYRKNSV
jgi:hypothetical protein